MQVDRLIALMLFFNNKLQLNVNERSTGITQKHY
jgi:hypothetical protein